MDEKSLGHEYSSDLQTNLCFFLKVWMKVYNIE